MSRLFYESSPPPAAAPLHSPLSDGPAHGTGAPKPAKAASTSGAAQKYLEKIAKTVPAEIVTGYKALLAVLAGIQAEDLRKKSYWGAFVICLVCTPLYMWWQSEKGRPKIVAIVLSTISFAIWAYDISGKDLLPTSFEPAMADGILVAFAIATGWIPFKR